MLHSSSRALCGLVPGYMRNNTVFIKHLIWTTQCSQYSIPIVCIILKYIPFTDGRAEYRKTKLFATLRKLGGSTRGHKGGVDVGMGHTEVLAMDVLGTVVPDAEHEVLF